MRTQVFCPTYRGLAQICQNFHLILITVVIETVLLELLLSNAHYKKKLTKLTTESVQKQDVIKKDLISEKKSASASLDRQETNHFPPKNNNKRKREPGLEESIFMKKSKLNTVKPDVEQLEIFTCLKVVF